MSGDTEGQIALRFGVTSNEMRHADGTLFSTYEQITPGEVITLTPTY